MRTRDLLKLGFQKYGDKLTLDQIYALGLEHKDEWDGFNSDYQHKIRTALHDLSRTGKVVRDGESTYRLLGSI